MDLVNEKLPTPPVKSLGAFAGNGTTLIYKPLEVSA